MLSEGVKNKFVKKYEECGRIRFQEFLVSYALERAFTQDTVKKTSPEIELFEYYEKFLALYRKDQQRVCLDIASQFRKAANKVYRLLLKNNMTSKSDKFLNVIK